MSQIRIEELIELAIDGSITAEQGRLLSEWIVSDPAVRRRYCEYMQLTVGIDRLCASAPDPALPDCDTAFDLQLWNQLACDEKNAPGLDKSYCEKPSRELIHRVVYPPREKRKISKFNVFVLLNTAAVILLFIFLNLALPRAGVKVATLTDSLNAQWADGKGRMENGTPIFTGTDNLFLREGLAEIVFDNRTKMIIEGPAEFQVVTEDQVKLNYGRAYAVVPREAIGFTIKTPSARIIDLGTEFGVEADFRGDTSLHVIEGKTVLIAGDRSSKQSVEVARGLARKVSQDTRAITEISCNDQLFVREIDSASGLAWRGQLEVDLADIVGGGNGFGTARNGLGINPATGQIVETLTLTARTQEESRYSAVPSNPFIDGVFVPLGGERPQVVSSRGDVFRECPATDGRYWIEISNNPLTGFEGNPQSIRAARLNGIEYGTKQHPAIMMHANTGVTFDLAAIRNVVPNTRIRRFTSTCGLSETLHGTRLQKDAAAEMWVLVDGQPREKVHVDFQEKNFAFVSVDIDEGARFLTLISCSDWNAGDWTIYGNPIIELESND